MGFNIQSMEFWDMRPDNFKIMSEAYDIKVQQEMIPYRKLMWVIASSQGAKVNEEDFMHLPDFDKPKMKHKPVVLSPDEIKKITEEHRKLGLI